MAKDPKDEAFYRPLAYDDRGVAFELTGAAKRWLVQRMIRARGRQETLYSQASRLPLQIPIESTVEDLENALRDNNYDPTGWRFRLVPVDAQGRETNECNGFVVFRDEEEDDEPRNSAAVVPARSGPSASSFDVTAVVQAVTDAVQRTMEPTLLTLRSTLDKLIAANIATTDGLLRSRVPQVFEPIVEDEEPSPLVEPQAAPSLVEQLSRVATDTAEMARNFMAMVEMMKQSQPSSAAPRNAAVSDPPIGFGNNGQGGGHP